MRWFFRKPSARLIIAILLSVVAHLWIGFWVGHKNVGSNVAIDRLHRNMTAALKAELRDAPETSLPVPRKTLKAEPIQKPQLGRLKKSLPQSSASTSPSPAKVFYPSRQLTVKPQFLSAPVVDALAVAPHANILLHLSIDEEGEVIDAIVLQSDLDEIFNQAVVGAFLKLRFSPGGLNGQKVGSLLEIEFKYRDGKPSGR